MQPRADGPASSIGSQPSNIFSCFCCGDGLGAHCEEGTDKQNAGAPKLGVCESLAIEPGRQRHRDRRTEEMETLRSRDSDFTARHVLQNVGERDTGYARDDQNKVRLRAGLTRSSEQAEG